MLVKVRRFERAWLAHTAFPLPPGLMVWQFLAQGLDCTAFALQRALHGLCPSIAVPPAHCGASVPWSVLHDLHSVMHRGVLEQAHVEQFIC